MIFPTANFYFLESRPVPVLENISFNEVMRTNDRPWLALSLVLCAHLAVFAALRPQPQSLSMEPIPDPIMVSLLNTPQTTPQKPMPPATPIEKVQKPVKKPASKPVAPLIKETNQPTQTSMPTTATSSPAAEPASKAIDTQTYQSPNFNAAYLNNPAPDYPSISRREGEQGLVLLRVQVTANGTAASVELQTSSGSTRLDQAALEAVKKWRFIPAKRGEQPVSASVTVPVRFSIEG
ncbi:MAG: energy transducer TonB [Methylobacter sp.]|nr:energy transducer TonB [Methylobacter sp.]